MCELCLCNQIMSQETKEVKTLSDTDKSLVCYLAAKTLSLDPKIAVFYTASSSVAPTNASQLPVSLQTNISDDVWKRAFHLATWVRESQINRQKQLDGRSSAAIVLRSDSISYKNAADPDRVSVHCCAAATLTWSTPFDQRLMTWDQLIHAAPELGIKFDTCPCQGSAVNVSKLIPDP